MTAEDCETQADIDLAFTNWLAQATVSGGCDPLLSYGEPVAPAACGGEVTVYFEISDYCLVTPITGSATFTVPAPSEVSYIIPLDKENIACSFVNDDEVLVAFNAWLIEAEEEAKISGGCNPKIEVDYGDLPDFCGGVVTVTWTISDKCIDPIMFSADFKIEPDIIAPVIHAPSNYTICNEPLPEYLMATWTDNCDEGGDLKAYGVWYSETECTITWSYTFNVTDECGNPADEVIVYVTRETNKYGNCETAFAKLKDNNARCFLDDGFNRWGWTNKITESTETYYLPLYAGAAQCDINKGTEVGTVEIRYFGGQISVEYIMHDGYVLNEAHIYVGCEMYPEIKQGKKTEQTVAPGQYTFVNSNLNSATGITVNFTDVSGDVYIIVHAVTCEAVCWCSDPQGVNGGPVFNKHLGINCGESPLADDKDNSSTIDSKSLQLKVYPNPFSSKVFFEFTSPKDARARLEISNALGQRTVVLMDKTVKKGVKNRIEYTPVNMITGILTYKLIIDDSVQTGRLVYRK